MSDAAEQLKPMLDALSADDRAALAEYLIRSLPVPGEEVSEEEAEAAWAAELNRRLADYESGKVQGIPGDEVMRRLREKYG